MLQIVYMPKTQNRLQLSSGEKNPLGQRHNTQIDKDKIKTYFFKNIKVKNFI